MTLPSQQLQILLLFRDAMDYVGSSVPGTSQARIREWVAIPFSRGSSHPGIELVSLALQADSLPSEPPGRPMNFCLSIKKRTMKEKVPDY